MTSYAIIGASRGIGLGFVKALSAKPENVVFAFVRNKASATELQDFVGSESDKHKNVIVLEADLDDNKTLTAAAKEVSDATEGKLDVLICNGAKSVHERSTTPLNEYPDEVTLEDDLLSFFKTNVVGTTHAINAFLPLLRAGKTKKVLVVTSSMGSPAFTMKTNYSIAVPYSISKAALNLAVAKFATAYKNEGFIFLAVSPGVVRTFKGPPDQVEKIYEGIKAQLRQANPNYAGAVSVEQSVRDQLALLERATPADTGAFVHPNGDDASYPSY